MAITSPFSITYGTRQVGGSTDYPVSGPNVIRKSYDELQLVFDVFVVGSSYSDLQSKADALETDFRKRLTTGQTLVVDLDGNAWTYTQGTTILDARASIEKSGEEENDRGYSRSYTVSIEGGLPADDDSGLRDLEVLVEHSASRQRTVTMRGVYTPSGATDAYAQYLAAFDAEASTILTALDAAATWELVSESAQVDRHGVADSNLTPFTRQYVELLANQSSGTLDDLDVRDHEIIFTDLSQHPGDSRENIYRLRRVIGRFDCAVDAERTKDLGSVFETKIRAHVKALFEAEFNPQVFAIEELSLSLNETTNRLSASIQFIYQAQGGDAIVEVAVAVAFRESRNIDYTHVHNADEFAAHADLGFASLERVWSRTVIVVGEESPRVRVIEAPKHGAAGPFDDRIGGQVGPDVGRRRAGISLDGWNIIASTSQVRPRILGDPDDVQVRGHVLEEVVTERFSRRPTTRTAVPIQRAAATG